MFIQSKVFVKRVVDDLIKRTWAFDGAARFFTLLFDEAKIKENLIFVKRTGNPTGLDIDINILNFEKKKDLNTHALVFFCQECYFKFKV